MKRETQKMIFAASMVKISLQKNGIKSYDNDSNTNFY